MVDVESYLVIVLWTSIVHVDTVSLAAFSAESKARDEKREVC